MPTTAPYGTWKSPITSDLIVQGSIALGQIALDGDDIYWNEMRPTEGGCYRLVRRGSDGGTSDVTPLECNVRTRVHEYGGAEYLVHDGTVYFSNFDDQRLYRQNANSAPEPLTSAVDRRYADGVFDAARNRIVCVREDHTDTTREAVNTIVAVDVNGGCDGVVLASGCDFYSSPRLSPDGKQLAWLQWNHPNMPWDGTELRVAQVKEDGSLAEATLIAGGLDESVLQPEWSPSGVLYFVSDRSNWWNLYRIVNGEIEAVCPRATEFARPAWVFGMASYGFESAQSLLCVFSEGGRQRLTRIDTASLDVTLLDLPFTSIKGLCVSEKLAVFIGGTSTAPSAVASLNTSTGHIEVLRHASETAVDAGYLSNPQAIEFPTEKGLTAHAIYYPPANADFTAPSDERSPLLVKSHGGPTSATSTDFNLTIQYWTSRGFAVVDVNYGGSTGYGREYRQRLNGWWGVVDVDDCINAAKYLVDQGLADENRLTIDGGSAGGYTTLCALAFRDVFKAGASYYGISDLSIFVGDTHKFESRYLDSLVGPYPEKKDLYDERSAIHSVDQLACPVIFFQGDEDKIVPPNQAEILVDVLRKKGIPVAYVLFEGEQHGFRKAENIKCALDGEFYFFAKVFGFQPADELEPVTIENL
jgi:dipeptidyl aminopeptidase/acylaminoacyl peptidase